MPEKEKENTFDRFYNVDRLKEVLDSQSAQPQAPLFRRFLVRIWRPIDSVSGLLATLSAIPVMFGGLMAVILGIVYGPLAFVATVGFAFGLLALYLNRKVGKSLQFGEYPVTRRLLAQVLGLAMALGFFLLLLSLPKVLPSFLP